MKTRFCFQFSVLTWPRIVAYMINKMFGFLRANLLFVFCATSLSLFAQPGVTRTGRDLTLFGRGLYPGDDSTFDLVRHSGFTTLMLSSFYIRADGDVYSGDDGRHPIIHQGVYTGNEEWVRRVRSLKNSGSVQRIEILLEGRWYNQPPNTYDFIRDWIDSGKAAPGVVPGTNPGSTLHTIVRILKDKLGADAICIDDESVYDSPSLIRLGEMAHTLGVHMTLCPFTKIPFWKSVLDQSPKGAVDAIYLQCYDGGKGNTPGPWIQAMGSSVPVVPIFLCRGAFSTCGTSHNSKTPDEIRMDMQAFRKESPGLKGGGLWQIADVKDYIRMNCGVQDPASGNATTVPQYLDQLRKSLE